MEVYWLLPVKATKENIKTMLNENGNFWMQNHNTNTIHKYFTYTVTLSMNNIMFFLKMSEQGTSSKLVYGFTPRQI